MKWPTLVSLALLLALQGVVVVAQDYPNQPFCNPFYFGAGGVGSAECSCPFGGCDLSACNFRCTCPGGNCLMSSQCTDCSCGPNNCETDGDTRAPTPAPGPDPTPAPGYPNEMLCSPFFAPAGTGECSCPMGGCDMTACIYRCSCSNNCLMSSKCASLSAQCSCPGGNCNYAGDATSTMSTGSNCGQGNCDLSGCTSNCQCAGGNCQMPDCKSNCQCAGGRCSMDTCDSNCQCSAGGCNFGACTSNCQCSGWLHGPCTTATPSQPGYPNKPFCNPYYWEGAGMGECACPQGRCDMSACTVRCSCDGGNCLISNVCTDCRCGAGCTTSGAGTYAHNGMPLGLLVVSFGALLF